MKGFGNYLREYKESIEKSEQFWKRQQQKLDWIKQSDQIAEYNGYQTNWFPQGQLNLCHNFLDRHVDQMDRIAIYEERVIAEERRQWTYRELLQKVEEMSNGLRSLGVKKGDVVIIYMPMVAEATIAMLACIRVGAVHSVVFGGFSSAELGNRIIDSKPKVIISASGAIENNKILSYQFIVQEALEQSCADIVNIIYERSLPNEYSKRRVKDIDFYQLLNRHSKQKADIEIMNTNDPLYILYTSGTTGRPKGLVRDQSIGVSLQYSMNNLLGIDKGDVYFCGSDIGWVVGHHFTVYGPLLVGGSTVVYEGKPVGTPDCEQWWRMIEKFKVKGLYGSPTAFRSIKKEDNDGHKLKQYDLKSLSNIALAGERCDVATMNWLTSNFPSILINDQYWQTESGYPIVANNMLIQTHPLKLGSATKPVPGFNLHILNNTSLENDQKESAHPLGDICIKFPLPPGFCKTILNNDQLFFDTYFKKHEGYYSTGDAGYMDQDGYIHIVSRQDDIINTAGHRLSTGQMEDILNHHQIVAESAVIGIKDSLKGEVPIGFIVLNPQFNHYTHQQVSLIMVQLIRQQIGPVASFKQAIVLPKLPKTRSGKILRNILRSISNQEQTLKIPPTIEDISVIPIIQSIIKENIHANKQDLVFEEDLS